MNREEKIKDICSNTVYVIDACNDLASWYDDQLSEKNEAIEAFKTQLLDANEMITALKTGHQNQKNEAKYYRDQHLQLQSENERIVKWNKDLESKLKYRDNYDKSIGNRQHVPFPSIRTEQIGRNLVITVTQQDNGIQD
jgi:hypothetical protein